MAHNRRRFAKEVDMDQLVEKARAFAHAARAGSICKYTGRDMISRHADIANTLAVHRASPELVAAGWLLDIHTDTDVPLGMVEHFFGPAVAMLVRDASHYGYENMSTANRAERMAIERERIADVCEEGHGNAVRTLKLAYMIVMTRLIVACDARFAHTYMREVRRVLGLLIGGHTGLFLLLASQVEQYFAPTAAAEAPPAASKFGLLRSPARYIQLVDSPYPLH
ncbi:HD domain-containing protein [Burkholderia sp. BCC0322]|uniref:HD domain-containing protein n=2 Tax=unclassified Burkholderia TaxID=2613784 RepID=UPI0032631FA8